MENNKLTKVDAYNALQSLELCIEMFDSPLVRNCDELEIDKVILPAILKAQKDLGFNPNEQKESHLLDGIALEIKRSVPNIRLAEIPIAINKGILGDYGDFLGLSIVTVIKFLKCHYTSWKRAEIAKQLPTEEPEKQIPTKEEQLDLARHHLLDSFERFKTIRDIGYSAVYLYRYLNEDFKVISFTNEVKWKIYYRAILGIKNQRDTGTIKTVINNIPKKDFELLNEFLKEYPDEIECAKKVAFTIKKKELLIAIKNESERLALIRFYNDLVEMETELKDILDNESNG
ncbi:hypothetical protein [Sphingobacterium sp.]|uniref:hypothetical protein n=1 Tax=Sphingobacterium sp. TaxID=341027 RepID=UPI0028AFAEB9|nr:hypothetical protein [Sphingobacterium sp.]